MVAVKRSFLFRLFNLLMALVVLTTSTGFGLVEHSCLMRGQTTLAFNKHTALKSCAGCPEQKTPLAQHQALKKGTCSTDHDVYQNVSFTSSLVHLMAKSVKAVGDALISACVWAVNGFVAAVLSLLQSTSISSAAVSLSGRSLLAFVQSLLI
ncbi:MAG: hypothetical protein LH606_02780 [Cytophagaceae bacterium]|nr:hypothetical protein [Cytophagaceae bacterium]